MPKRRKAPIQECSCVQKTEALVVNQHPYVPDASLGHLSAPLRRAALTRGPLSNPLWYTKDWTKANHVKAALKSGALSLA